MLDLNTMMTPPKEPSWKHLAKLVREMTPDERREFFRVAFLPWPNRKDNLKMLALCGAGTAAYGVVTVALVHAVGETYTLVQALPLSFMVGVTMTTATLQMWLRQFALGIRARKAEVTKAMMAEVQKVVDEFGGRIVERLKEATGREHIDMNPISMAAANIEVMEKAKRPAKPENPLQAALEDRLHPNDLVRDDDDDESTI